MGEWEAKILTSEIDQSYGLGTNIAKHLNLGWKIEGYSVDGKSYSALLVKKTKEDND